MAESNGTLYLRLSSEGTPIKQKRRKHMHKKILGIFLAAVLLLPCAASAKESDTCPYRITVNLTDNIVTIYEKDSAGRYTTPDRAFVCSAGSYSPQRRRREHSAQQTNTSGARCSATYSGSTLRASPAAYCSIPSPISNRTKARWNMTNTINLAQRLQQAASA